MVARTLFYGGGGAPVPEEEVPPPAAAEPTPAPAPEPAPQPAPPAAAGLYGGTAEAGAPPPQEAAPAPAPEPQPAPQATPAPEPAAPLAGLLPEPVNRAIDDVGGALQTVAPEPLNQAGRAIEGAVGGLMGVGEAQPPQRPGVRDVGEAPAARDARRAAREAGHSVVGNAPAPVDLIREGADRLGSTVGRARDDPGGLAADVGGALGGAAEAVAADPGGALGAAKDAAFGAAAEGLTWAENRVAQAAASRTLDRLSGQEPEDTLVGRALDTVVPLNERIMADPALQEAALDAFRNGTTKQDGTFVEPGERAAWEAIYDRLSPAEQVVWSARTDPTFVPSIVAGLGAGAVPRLGARLGPTAFKVARPVGGALKAAEVALDTVGGAGLNLAVPKALGVASDLFGKTPLGRPSARTLAEDLVAEQADAGDQLLGGVRAAMDAGAQRVRATADDLAQARQAAMPVQPGFSPPELPPIRSDDPVANRYAGDAPLTRYGSPEEVPVGPIEVADPSTVRQGSWRVGADNRFQVDHGRDPRTGRDVFFLMENAPIDPTRRGAQRTPVGQFYNLDEAVQTAQRLTVEWQNGRPAPRNLVGRLDIDGRPLRPEDAPPSTVLDPDAGARRPAARPPTVTVRQQRPQAVGLYADDFEAAVGAPLADDVRAVLNRPVTVRGVPTRVGDHLLDLQMRVDEVRDAVATGNWTPRLETWKRQFDEAFAGHAPDWPTMTDAEADLFARKVAERDFQAAAGLLREGKGGVGAAAVKAWDEYLTARRNVALYNLANGGSYVSMQGTGNALTLLLNRPLALPDFFKVWDWGKVRRLGDGDAAGWAAHPLARSLEAYGEKGAAGLGETMHARMGDGTWFSRPGRGPLLRAVGLVVANPKVRSWANMLDTNLRVTGFAHEWFYGTKKLRMELPAKGKATAARLAEGAAPGFRLGPRAVERVLKDLDRRAGEGITGGQIRDALLEAAGPAATGLDRRIADRVARDWVNDVRTLRRSATAATDEIAFDFRNSNLDEVLQRTVLFHWWLSRASMLYLKQGFRHPWQIKTWADAVKAGEENREDSGRPGWMGNYVEFMQTPAGVAVAANPWAIIPALALAFETGNENPLGDYTAIGKFLDDGPGGNLFLNPILRGAIAWTGAGGADFSSPDLLGTAKLEREINDWVQFGNVMFNGFIASKGGVPVQAPTLNTRAAVSNFAANLLSGWLPGTVRLNTFDAGSGFQDDMQFYAREYILANNPSIQRMLDSGDPAAVEQGIAELSNAITAAMADPTSPAHQHALEVRAVQQPFAGPGFGLPGPLGQVAAVIANRISPIPLLRTSVAEDEYRRNSKGGGTPTAADEAIKGLRYEGPPDGVEARFWDAQRLLDDEVALSIMSTLRAQHPDWSYDQLLAETRQVRADALDGKVRPEWTQAQVVARAGDRYQEIAFGEITAPLTVRGQTIRPETLASLDQNQRYQWADAWAEEQGVAQVVAGFKAARDEIVAANPMQQAWEGWKQLYKNYDGGPDAFIADLRKGNPGYEDFYQEQVRTGGVPGSEEFTQTMLSKAAFLAAEGVQTQFAPKARGNGWYPGVKQGQGLASYYAESRENRFGGSAEDAEKLATDLDKLNLALGVAAQYGVQDLLIARIKGETTEYLPRDAYDAIKATVGFVPSGDPEYGDERAYLQWLATNPADPSAQAFYRETGGRAPAAEDPDAPLPTVPGQDAAPAAPAFDVVAYLTGRAPTADAAAPEPPGVTVVPVVPRLNVRADPGGALLGQVGPGDRLRVVEKRLVGGEGWALVALPDGSRGWVAVAHLGLPPAA